MMYYHILPDTVDSFELVKCKLFRPRNFYNTLNFQATTEDKLTKTINPLIFIFSSSWNGLKKQGRHMDKSHNVLSFQK